ncbi:GMP synthase [Actinidia chinensis var. chinensis]|uniref:GMP synthase n=1 Tax=Actinidia chinensis var. chinensis TaxID=1590841 RepID=A0A2R6R3F4_ACTCC|nr:GMP synthase [Actinidia chinensis var. chinensis]
MSVATEHRSPAKPSSEARALLGAAGNRVRVSEEAKRKKESLKKNQKPSRLVSETPCLAAGNNLSVDSTCSSDSSLGGSSVKMVSSKRRMKPNGLRSVKVVPDGVESAVPIPVKRCDWITANSDPLYTAFHDEEWGVPVHDDRKLFELLVLSQALAEFTWPAILSKRDMFRKFFDDFDPSLVAKFTEKKVLSLRSNGSTSLSEPKLRAVVENANQTLKIQQEFGSFSNYCWSFINHKPIRNGFRYARQVPVKIPKAEIISKDLMHRGFRCVGPSVVYSFMQVAGLANDHLVTCFRYHECNNNAGKDQKPKNEDIEVRTNANSTRSSHD